MADPMKDAWANAAEGFSALGRAIKERYEGDDPPPRPDAAAAGFDDALRAAFERFVAAGREIGQRAVEVARDPQVGTQARQFADRLEDALSATVDTIGREVEGWFRRPAEPVEPVEATDRLIEGGAHDDAEAAIEAGGEPVDDDRVEGPNSA
jgi:hypothetical protein